MSSNLPDTASRSLRVIATAAADGELGCALMMADVGEVRFDRHLRQLYATDASLYQVEPLAVVIPRSVQQVQRLVEFCRARRIALLPRGGGTSLAGQCTNEAVVVDLSPSLRRLIDARPDEQVCNVEPGISPDELNRQLQTASPGWFYAPDPATSAQAAIGGCIGNNAAGARSIKYGRTSENVVAVDVILTSGQRTRLSAGAGRSDPVARGLAEQVIPVVREHADLIRQRFPKTIRRNAGYALDGVLAQLDRGIGAEDLDLAGLICGSEGTLAVVVGATLRLRPSPKARGLALASFATLEEAINAVVPINALGPSAVELLDDVVLEAAAGNPTCRRYLPLIPEAGGKPARAVLYVEFESERDAAELPGHFARLREVLPGVAVRVLESETERADAWALRKAGEPLLHGLSGKRKPITFVEDNAVPPERLVEFVARFKAICAKHGTVAAYWAHASVGVLHVRPMLDLHDAEDRRRMRAIAEEVAELARDCGGVMSGEHGDGRVRGPLLERFYGPQLMAAFGRIKRIFDPEGILNPGMIVEPGPVSEITEQLRLDREPLAPKVDAIETFFDYEDQDGFRGAVEMCNGAGFCRKTSGGTMCPSYRATLDERHSTRGRGNALRLAITGQIAPSPAWDDPETIQTLHLCLSCKACKSECPSNVDVARLKAEYTAQRYRQQGTPLQAKLFGHIRRLNRLGSTVPGLANWFGRLRPVRAVLNGLLGLAPQRSMPPFAKSLAGWFRRRPASPGTDRRPRVVLFNDCFTGYNEPRIGQAAVRVLEALGYAVELPAVGCCGRAMISMGLLADATTAADRNLEILRPWVERDDVRAIVVCEPSCASTICDEWLQLKLRTPRELRQRVAAMTMPIEEFVERHWDRHPARPAIAASTVADATATAATVLYHGHCHQKALGGEAAAVAAVRRAALAGETVTVIPSGCCGMAGSFGYTRDRYELSLKIGELTLFPVVRAAGERAIVLAPGTSCRHQIKDGTGRAALHPIEFLAARLAPELAGS